MTTVDGDVAAAVDGDVAAPVTPIGRRPLQIRELRIWSTTLRVGVWQGSSRRPPLLIFNGIGASLELLGPFADALHDVELISYDMPGTGESGMPPLPYRLWMLALLTDRLLDRLGYDRIDALGVSWGGGIAQQFALQNPRRCRRLVLAATCAGVTMIPPKPSVLAKFMTPRRYNDPAYLASVADQIYGGDAATNTEALGQFKRAGGTKYPGYLLQQLAIVGWTSLPWLRLVRQPTLILAGSDDRIVPLANADLLAWAIPDSRKHCFDDGHLFLITDPVSSATVIDEFLSEPERSAVAPR
jgi:poly(3-hydroxyoctanoate) depolymerase